MARTRSLDNGKVLIISQYFYPDIAATGKVLTELAEDLVKAGREVKVITGQPSYGEESGGAQRREVHEGIEIERVGFWRLSKSSKAGRILSHASFFVAVLLRLLFTGNYHSLLIVSNPPILPLIGVILKKVRKFNFVYLVHDIYPDIGIKIGVLGEGSFVAKVLNLVNKKAFRVSDTVVALGQDARDVLLKKGVPEDKIKVITNWSCPIQGGSRTGSSPLSEFEGKFTLLYTGNLGLCHGLGVFVEAAEKLKDFEDIQFVFVGEGGRKKQLREEVRKKGLGNVLFFPYQTDEAYPELLANGDILLLSLAEGIEGLSVPSKTYSYLASGKPIGAAISPKSDIGKLIEEHKCGFRVDPDDSGGFCREVIRFYKNPDLRERCSRNSRDLFDKSFRRSEVTRRYLEVL